MKQAPKVPKQRILTAALLLALAHPAYAQQATEAEQGFFRAFSGTLNGSGRFRKSRI